MDHFLFQPCSSWVITLWKLFTTELLSGQFPIRGLCKPAVAPVACQIQPLGTSRPTWVLSDWAFQQRLDSRTFKGNIYKMTWNSIRVSCCVGKALSKDKTFFKFFFGNHITQTVQSDSCSARGFRGHQISIMAGNFKLLLRQYYILFQHAFQLFRKKTESNTGRKWVVNGKDWKGSFGVCPWNLGVAVQRLISPSVKVTGGNSAMSTTTTLMLKVF